MKMYKCCQCGKEKEAEARDSLDPGKLFCSENCKRICKVKEYPSFIEAPLGKIGVPKRFIQSSFDNFKGMNEQKKTISENITSELMVIMGEECGSGKTHLACAALRERYLKAFNQFKADMFVNTSKMLFDAQNQMSQGREQTAIKGAIETDYLVLDDLGSESSSDYRENALYIIINERYANNKKTLVTTNLNMTQIDQRFGNRMASRLSSGIIVKLLNEDYRMKGMV